MKTESLPEQIMSFADTLDEGTPILADDLADLGDRGAINRSLALLASCGRLTRVARGIYVQPVVYRFGKYTPGGRETVENMAERRGEYVSTTVGMSANYLQLTNSVPMHEMYLMSGRTREYTFGRKKVVVRHAPLWQVILQNSMPGHVLRGLHWLGSKWFHLKLDAMLREADMSEEERKKLLEVRNIVPDWMIPPLEKAAAHG